MDELISTMKNVESLLESINEKLESIDSKLNDINGSGMYSISEIHQVLDSIDLNVISIESSVS